MNIPDWRIFPWPVWQRLLGKRVRENNESWRGYARTGGNPELRAALADYLRLARGVACTPEQVLITGSTQQALGLLALALADPGDCAWVEDPGYQGAQAAFTAAGLTIYPQPVDTEGIAWQNGDPPPRLIYATPSHQLPLGVVMSLARRRALLELASSVNAWVIEDDYDGEFRHVGRPFASLQGLDGGQRVIYLGTFSKVLFPGLHIAYMVVPQPLVEPVRLLHARLVREGQHAEQAALADFIREGHFAAHIRRARVLYGQRLEKLQSVFAKRLGERLVLEGTEAGMHLVASFPVGIDDVAASRLAAAADLIAPPLSREYLTQPPRSGLLLGYGGIDDDVLLRAAHKLTTLLDPILP